jgi:hypothetical protein
MIRLCKDKQILVGISDADEGNETTSSKRVAIFVGRLLNRAGRISMFEVTIRNCPSRHKDKLTVSGLCG